MQYKIGVFGSNIVESDQAVKTALELGAELARAGCIVITGACSGMPYAVAHAARQQGAEIWGFSPELNEAAQREAYPNDDITIYTKLFYVPQQYNQLFFLSEKLPSERDWGTRLKYRNVISTTQADAGILISGGWGTLNEFTNLLYEGKLIGALTGTGGLADALPAWFPTLRKKSESKVLFSSSPAELVASLMAVLQETADQ